MPEITVLMSVYNGQQYLRQCIESILSQTNGDFEFLIIDDGSTDNTPSILASYQDARMKIIRQENCGLTKSLNRGLSLAQGNFVARIDADDIAMPDRFERQLSFLQSNPNVAVVGSNAILIDENGNRIGIARFPCHHNDIIKHLELSQSLFPHSSAFFRREAVLSVGGYNERFIKAQDYDLYLRLCQKYQLACLEEPLISLRLSLSSLAHSDGKHIQRKMARLALISYLRRQKGLEDFSLSSDDRWEKFVAEVSEWFDTKGYGKKLDAKKWFRQFRTMIQQRQIIKAIQSFLLAFRFDLLFFTYKGIGLKIPDDLCEFTENFNTNNKFMKT